MRKEYLAREKTDKKRPRQTRRNLNARVERGGITNQTPRSANSTYEQKREDETTQLHPTQLYPVYEKRKYSPPNPPRSRKCVEMVVIMERDKRREIHPPFHAPQKTVNIPHDNPRKQRVLTRIVREEVGKGQKSHTGNQETPPRVSTQILFYEQKLIEEQ
ncbi:hypothetical protein BJ508DRAFT_380160 [Ascobolus immersus RN42]|uniref:Uncharacterized protein n=1 Tax=Ascobolus immersus RN42 TaxID=1160509 RepID=A0A3N4HQH0_ASCIM|nr:hypothetical protein BJ508DRAFT_380160 [Ascobolus immersus RN42]